MPLLRRRKRDSSTAGLFSAGWDVPAQFNFTRDVIEALASDPTRAALTFVDAEGIVDRRTFNDLAKDAARWAHLLRTRIDRGERVVFVLGKTPAWHGAMLGALKSGLVSVPCADMLRARDIAFRVKDSGARLVVADRSCEVEVEEMRNQTGGVPVVYVDDAQAELNRYMPVAKTEDTLPLETAFILYTSGTTKDPKGVVHAHAYTWAKRMQASHWLDASERDVVWCTAGTGWAKAIWNQLLGPWSQGAEVVMHEGPFEPEERLALIQRLGVTILCQAPTEYRMLAKLDKLGTTYLPRLRHLVSAGEPLNPEVITEFQETLGLTIHDGYGQTENSLLVANSPSTPVRPGSMGLPTPGHDVAIIDESGNVCGPGVEGDIAMIGRPPTLFRGYWNNADETDAVFRDGWYVTGDRAVRDEEGYLWFVGRDDDVIISSGYRIGPFEVESALLEHPSVAESAVVGAADPERGQIVKAFVVLRPGEGADERLASELQEHVKAVTAPYKYPRAIAFVDELPKTVSGKILRRELREPGAPVAASALTIVPRAAEILDAEAAEAAAVAELEEQREKERAEAEAAARREAQALERARAEREAEALRRAREEERARLEAEETARREAEDAERARAEAEAAERERREAEAAEQARLRAEAAERARLDVEAATRREAEEQAQRETEAAEAAARARLEAAAAEQARLRAEEGARREAEEAARREAEEAAHREAEEAERVRAAAEETARREAEEAARRETEEAARLRAEAEEAARLRAEAEEAERRRAEQEAAEREADEAARAEAERALVEARAQEARVELEEAEDEDVVVLEPASPVDELDTGRLEDDRGEHESRWSARRRRREEAAMAKAVAEEAKRRAKAEAEQRKRYEKDAKADARRRAAEEKEAARRQVEDERRRAEEEKLAAKARAEEEKRRAEDDRQREIRERAEARVRAEEERRQEREAAKAGRRALGIRRRHREDEFDDDGEPVAPIPDLVDRLRRYSGDIAWGTTMEEHERETGTNLEEYERQTREASEALREVRERHE